MAWTPPDPRHLTSSPPLEQSRHSKAAVLHRGRLVAGQAVKTTPHLGLAQSAVPRCPGPGHSGHAS